MLSHHTEQFDIDEESLMIGASIFVQLIDALMINPEVGSAIGDILSP